MKKRSENVILLMLGTGLGIAALSDDKSVEQLRQDSYASRAECVQDWGTEQSCREEPSQGGSYSGSGSSRESGRYQGPRYYWDRASGHPVVVTDSGMHQAMNSAHAGGDPLSHSIGTAHAGTVTRGGFGHFSSLGRGG